MRLFIAGFNYARLNLFPPPRLFRRAQFDKNHAIRPRMKIVEKAKLKAMEISHGKLLG